MLATRKILLSTIVLFGLLISSLPSSANQWDKLFDYAKYENVKISPDGKHLAVSLLIESKRGLAFLDRKTMALVGTALFPGRYQTGDYYWVNNERVVIDMVKKDGWRETPVSYGELFAVNLDGSKGSIIYGFQAGTKQVGSRIKKKKSTRGWAKIIDTLPNDDKHILISSTPMTTTPKPPGVYKLNVYSGVMKRRISTAPIPHATFLTDTNGKLKAVVGTDKNDHEQLYIRKNDEWHHVGDNVVGKKVIPVSVSASGKSLFTIDDYQQDLKGLFELNLEDYSYKSVFTDKKVNISGIEMTTDGRSTYAVKLDDGYPSYVILDKKMEEAKVYKNLVKSFPYSEVTITSKTLDGKIYIVQVNSDIVPGRTYLFNLEKNELQFIFQHHDTIKSSELAEIEPIKFKASDGQIINGFFTAAKNKKSDQIAPVVIMVHGGPHGVRDYWSFSRQVQYLALNGYSVLQVNYRGSGGYGRNFELAGHRAWGTISQQDIHEGFQWLVKQNKAQAGKACIMGASFGAYSAIQSTTMYPDSYQCAIGNAGVYDLELMFEEGDIQKYDAGMSYLKRVLGTDKALLKSMSPVNYVDKIKVPLLIAHGEKDERAPFEHAEKLREALDKSNKQYEWVAIDKEGHGFFNPENQKSYMKKVITFLEQHLG